MAHHSSLDESICHVCLGQAENEAAVDASFRVVRPHPLGPRDSEAGMESLVLLLQGGDVRCFGWIDGVESHAMDGDLEELLRGCAGLAEALRPTLLPEECLLISFANEKDADISARKLPGGDDAFRLCMGLLNLVDDGFIWDRRDSLAFSRVGYPDGDVACFAW